MRHSAGLLPSRRGDDGELLVWVGHMGGPFWARKDAGAWSVIKGEYDPSSEDAQSAAEREFLEETGAAAPNGERIDLGEVRANGKAIHVWAVAAPADLAMVEAGTFEMEWPPRSGRLQSFPEIDRAAWLRLGEARTALVKGQLPFLDRLEALLGVPRTASAL